MSVHRLWVALMVLCWLPAHGQQISIPNDLACEVALSERLGLALFESYRAAHASPSSTPNQTASLAEAAIGDRCEGPYNTFIVKGANTQDPLLAYVVGTPDTSTGIMVGRHYRVELSPDGGEVLAVSSSTRSCLFIPAQLVPPGGRPAAVSVSHMLSSAPNEFHVFLSLLHGKPIYVGTDRATWKVDGARVSLVEAR